MAINTRSPHYVSINTISYSALLNITIWTGQESSPPSVNDYQLKKIRLGSSSSVTFEISELIRDFIEITFDGNYTGQAVWVKTVITGNSLAGGVINGPFTETNLALDSYSYFQEPTFNVSDSPIMISNRTIFALGNNLFRIPVYSAFEPIITFYKDNKVVVTQTVSKSDDSTEQIKYISAYGWTTDYDTYAERVIEDGGIYEGSLCLNNFFDSTNVGVIDRVNVVGNRIGSEIIENGDFATDTEWTKLGSATISGGSANIIGTLGEVSGIRQSLVFEEGKDYVVTLDIVVNSGVGVKIQDDVTDSSVGTAITTGSYSFNYIGGTGTGLNIRSRSSGTFNCTVSNVSVKEKSESYDNIIIKTIDECKYDPKKITFVNKFGALQDMYFFKKRTEKITVKKESYKANIISPNGTYSTSSHVNRDFNVLGQESISLSSGFLNESYNEVFKQMLLSEKVWITNVNNGVEQVLPINVKTSDITYKTSLNDKLVEYTIEFDNSYDTINNIR